MRGKLLASLVLSFIFLSCCPAAELKPRELRLGSAWPPPDQSLIAYGHKMWADEITRRTDGKITFKFYWGAALGKGAEYLGLVQKGMIDVGSSNAQNTPGKLPLGQYEYVFPLGPTDPVIVTKAKRRMEAEFPQIVADWEKYNGVHIMHSSGGVYNIHSAVPLRHLEDFRGKKVALIGRYFGRWMEPLGAVPVVAPAQERYTMLQTGINEMDLSPVDLALAFKHHEQTKYYIVVEAMLGNFGDLWMNRRTFNSFPPEIQQLFLDVGREVEMKIATEVVPEWTKRAEKAFSDQGLEFIAFPSDERAKWAQLTVDIPAEWAEEVTAQGYPGWDMVRRWQEITSELGYEWPRKWGVRK